MKNWELPRCWPPRQHLQRANASGHNVDKAHATYMNIDILELLGQSLRLRLCNVVDEEADTTLRDHIRRTIAELDADDSPRTTEAQEREEVDNRISAPRDDGRQTDLVQHAGNIWIRLLGNGTLQANKQLVDDEEEHGEREAKAHQAEGEISFDDKFARIADRDHER